MIDSVKALDKLDFSPEELKDDRRLRGGRRDQLLGAVGGAGMSDQDWSRPMGV